MFHNNVKIAFLSTILFALSCHPKNKSRQAYFMLIGFFCEKLGGVFSSLRLK
jgi:hypothetical protein